MGIVSLIITERLYWLGRYAERVYASTRRFRSFYDSLIDGCDEEKSIEEFCLALDIPNIYGSDEDFLQRFCFDPSNPDSLRSNLERAYDNAIVLRSEIGSGTLAYIQMAVFQMERAGESETPLIELQHIEDMLMAFWGKVDDAIANEQIRNVLKSGKRVEHLDLLCRFKCSQQEIAGDVARLERRLKRTDIPYKTGVLQNLKDLAADNPVDHRAILVELGKLM